jgi:hypothetical protein
MCHIDVTYDNFTTTGLKQSINKLRNNKAAGEDKNYRKNAQGG